MALPPAQLWFAFPSDNKITILFKAVAASCEFAIRNPHSMQVPGLIYFTLSIADCTLAKFELSEIWTVELLSALKLPDPSFPCAPNETTLIRAFTSFIEEIRVTSVFADCFAQSSFFRPSDSFAFMVLERSMTSTILVSCRLHAEGVGWGFVGVAVGVDVASFLVVYRV